MAIPITGKFKPLGEFPLADASDIEMPDGTRLDKAIENASGVVVSPEPPKNTGFLWIDPSDNGRDSTVQLSEALGQIDALLGGGE